MLTELIGNQEETTSIKITVDEIINLLALVYERKHPEVLHIEDIERILRISHYTSLELVKKQEFPSMKIGKYHKIPRDEFFRWLSESAKKKNNVSIT